METINRDINRIMRTIRRANGSHAKSCGLGEGEMRTLHFIHHNPGVTQQEICQRFDINKAATARQCAALEEKGYIRREKNANDARSWLLFPTDKAEEFKQQNIDNESRVYEELIAPLTEEERQELSEIIKKICAGIEERRQKGVRP